MEQIAVVGAGTMGLDIALCFARHGYPVTVQDVTDEIIGRAWNRLTLTLENQVDRGRCTQTEAGEILSRISFSLRPEDCAAAVLVIEAVVEDAEVKRRVFARLDELCAPETILATNTSSQSVTEIAAATANPRRVVGMHFFNPVSAMKLVEVVRGARTAESTVEQAMAWARRLDKEPIRAEDSPAFVVNRILVPMLCEAISVLESGVASAEDIDRGMRLGCNHPMGPLALCDMAGLDVVLAVAETLLAETGDSKYRPPLLLRRMVRAGLLGRKTGEGFFTY